VVQAGRMSCCTVHLHSLGQEQVLILSFYFKYINLIIINETSLTHSSPYNTCNIPYRFPVGFICLMDLSTMSAKVCQWIYETMLRNYLLWYVHLVDWMKLNEIVLVTSHCDVL